MKQITITQYGNPSDAFEMQEKKQPEPTDMEVLIEVEGFGLNYADVMARNGLYKDAPDLPFVSGYEVVGKVVKIGKDVPETFLEKRVVAFTRFGGYAEFAVTDYRGIAVIDDTIPGGEACALATQYCTAFYMTDYVAKLHEGDTALIHACAGGVGTALTQLCKHRNVHVIGLCSTDEKVDYLKTLGVDTPINYKKEDYKTVIEEKFGTRKVDYAFNPVAGKSFKQDMKLLAFGGKIFCYGASSRSGKGKGIWHDLMFLLKTGFISPLFLTMKSQAVMGVNMLRIADYKKEVIGQCLKELIQLHQEGVIRPQVGAEFKAAEIAQAHELLESGKSTGKIYVHW